MATLADNDVATNDASGTSLALPAMSVSAGDLVVVAYGYEGATDTPTCSDGTAYTALTHVYNTSINDLGGRMFYRVVSSGGTVTATVTSASRPYRKVLGWVFTPAGGTTWAFDVEATGGFGNSDTPTTSAASATAAGAAVAAFPLYSTRGFVPGSGWSEAGTHNVDRAIGGEYQFQAGAGSLTGNGTIFTGAADWVALMAIWKEVAGGADTLLGQACL